MSIWVVVLGSNLERLITEFSASRYTTFRHYTLCGPDSVVGTATGYGLDGSGIESRWERDFPHLSRPALGSIQPPVQWVPGVKSGRDVTLTPHPLLVPWSRKGRVIPLLHVWAVRPVQSLRACTRVHYTVHTGHDFCVTPCSQQVTS